MTCVRCGDPKQLHCRADGGNVRNAACAGFLERWEQELPAEPEKPVAVDEAK